MGHLQGTTEHQNLAVILSNSTSRELGAIVDICALASIAVAFGIVSKRIRHSFFIGALFSPSLIVPLI